MSDYTSGTYTLIGVVGGVSATVAASSAVTFNLAGALSTFTISSNSGSTVTINNALDVADNLSLDTNGGSIAIGTLAGALGTVDVTIDQGGSFTAGGTVLGLLDSGAITYSSGGGTAVLGTAGDFVNLSFAPVFDDFTSSSDIIDDRELQFSGFRNYTITGSGTGSQTVTINDSAGSFTFTTNAAGLTDGTYTSLVGGPLTLTADASGGTDITACFLTGTLIRTPEGDVPVEALRAGGQVLDIEGRTREIRWIGMRRIATWFADMVRLMPVRIRAGALGENTPARDLLVSPDHALFLDGVLVHAGALVNGTSIVRERAMPPHFTYYHVEVVEHALILAEGAAAESFINNIDRMAFDNWAEYEALYGHEPDVAELPYPRAKSVRQIPAGLRGFLAARAEAPSSAMLLSA